MVNYKGIEVKKMPKLQLQLNIVQQNNNGSGEFG